MCSVKDFLDTVNDFIDSVEDSRDDVVLTQTLFNESLLESNKPNILNHFV